MEKLVRMKKSVSNSTSNRSCSCKQQQLRYVAHIRDEPIFSFTYYLLLFTLSTLLNMD